MLVFMLIYTNADCNLALKFSNLFCLIYSISENIFCSFKIHCLFFCKMRIFRSFWIISVTKAQQYPTITAFRRKSCGCFWSRTFFSCILKSTQHFVYCIFVYCVLCAIISNIYSFSFLFSSLLYLVLCVIKHI